MSTIGWMIIACEVLFWVFILLGLTARYLFKKEKLGFFLLALTPVIDLLLLIATSIDLYRGASASMAHGLAAVYIGVSIAFGKSMIQWADARFQHYVSKTELSKPIKKFGIDFAKHNAKGFIRHIIAFVISSSILGLMIVYIDDSSRTEALTGIMKVWSFILAIDLYLTISYFIWPKKEKKGAPSLRS
jgi:hypothetical protein